MSNDEEETMDIYAQKGTKVVYKYPDAGYPHDQETAKKHLALNGVYTVEGTVVHDWSTDVYLKEVPGVAFNSVLFSGYKEKPKSKKG